MTRILSPMLTAVNRYGALRSHATVGRAAFNAFAEEYTEQGYSRYEAWLRAEHEAALDGDGTARRQYLGRAVQRSDIDLDRSLDVTLTWADGTRVFAAEGGDDRGWP